MALLVCATVLSSCGGGGGGSDGGSCVDISGVWNITETAGSNTCGDPAGQAVQHVYTVVQNGCSFTATTSDARTYNGTVSGNNVSWTGSNPGSGGTITVTGTSITAASDGNSMNGSGNWTWSNGNPSYDCSGTTSISGARQSNGPATVDASGTWGGSWNSSTPHGPSGSFAAIVSQSGTTLSGTISVPYISLSNATLKGSVHGNTITFGDIADTITFTGTMTGDAASGNYNYSSGADVGTWSGTRTAPPATALLTITGVYPAAFAQNVSIYTAVTVTFSESIFTSSVTNSTFILSGGNGTIAGSISTGYNMRTAVFTPSYSLAANATYTVTIGEGVHNQNVTTSLASDYIWSFTTGTDGGGTTYVSTDVPKSIPDNVTTGVTSSLLVSGGTTTISKVKVALSITHTYDGDLQIYLVSAAGTTVGLSVNNGGGGNDYSNTVFDDNATTLITDGTPSFAGVYKPEGILSALNGQDANGIWKLLVNDDSPLDVGRIEAWSITIQ